MPNSQILKHFGYSPTTEDEAIYILAKHGKENENEENDVKEIPTLLVYGVTMLVSGAVLYSFPFPICKDWGGKMVMAGLSTCASVLAPAYDEKKDKNKEKEKKK